MNKEQLKADRLKMGFTQKQMAEKLKTPYKTYVKWELGTHPIKPIVEVALKSFKCGTAKRVL